MYSEFLPFWVTWSLVLLSYPEPVVSNCPMGCKSCNESDGYSVDGSIRLVRSHCEHNSWMTEVPSDLPKTIGTLLFKSNALKIIKTSSLQSYKYLRNLDLANNGIEVIENRSFQNQRYLKKLDLKNNLLDNLTRDMFVGLVSLQKLDLENNRISSLSGGVFRMLTALKYLDLHDNPLVNIEGGAFDSLDYLQKIELGGCRLKKLQTGSFGNLMSLKTIDLSSNMIDSIDPGTLSCSPLLETLHLNDNNLRDVPVIVLSRLRLLKDLDLSENPLTSISSKAFLHNPNLEILNLESCELGFLQEGAFEGLTNLRELFLNGNPLGCDCRLRWLRRLMDKSKDIFKKTEFINCSSPAYVAGKKLVDLSLTELKCNCTTCIQDAKCNGVACASCSQGGAVEPRNRTARVLCHSYNGRCVCGDAVPKPTTWNCTFNMTNITCGNNAALAVVGRRNIACRCNAGFQGDGVNCSDINECYGTGNQCPHLKMLCRNTIGSYSCYCAAGYKVTDYNHGCQDINECDDKSSCLGSSDCYNTEGERIFIASNKGVTIITDGRSCLLVISCA